MLHPRLQIAEELLEPSEFDCILSVGARRGELERRWADRVAHLDVVDVEAAKDTDPWPENIHFQEADVTKELPFPDESFDKVLYLEVMEHLPRGSEVVAFREIRRVLRPGGLLVMSTPHWHPIGCATDPAYWLRDHRHYRTKHVVGMMSANGFDVRQVLKRGGVREALLVPAFYAADRLGVGKAASEWIHRRIAKEYRREGWYTLFVQARKEG